MKLTPKQPVVVLILWGDSFDGAAAVIFATELRRAGLSVKVVGLSGRHSAGLHGLLLGVDLTLGDAMSMADRAVGVILPCTLATIQRVDNDPRVFELLQRACANHTRLVVQHPEVIENSRLRELSTADDRVYAYGEADNLIAFAQSFAITVSAQISALTGKKKSPHLSELWDTEAFW